MVLIARWSLAQVLLHDQNETLIFLMKYVKFGRYYTNTIADNMLANTNINKENFFPYLVTQQDLYMIQMSV